MCMVIYKTTNLVNGKIYVGKDSLNDPAYFGSGTILARAIRKYGLSSFRKDILEVCSTPQELDNREQHWIRKLKSTDRKKGYNIASGGTGGDTFTNQPAAKKQSIIQKRESTRPLWLTDDYRQKISQSSKKLWTNPQHRDHMTKLMEGREIKWSDKISKAITEWHKTNLISADGLRRISEAAKQAKGRILKDVSEDVCGRIAHLYQDMGPKTMSKQLQSEGIDISPYLIIRVLKQLGVYQKWQKGIGK